MNLPDSLKTVIDEYRKSGIQSEAEVRSKFVVPLLEALGYPSELRSEEFPVYGYSGRTKLDPKHVDFLLFDDKDFAMHRKNKHDHIEWVRAHSLLVVEAKKPGEIPEEKGQAEFYCAWTRSLAYIITDGERFISFLYNPINNDFELIDGTTDDILHEEDIDKLSFEHLSSLKQSGVFDANIDNDEYYHIIESDDELDLPDESLDGIREMLGREAEGLSKVQLLAKFLNLTDAILSNDIRYDIPEYMLMIPRRFYDAQVFIDSSPHVAFEGTVNERYRNETTIYTLNTSFIDIIVVFEGDQLVCFGHQIHALDERVTDRIRHLKIIKQCFEANELYIITESGSRKVIKLPVNSPKYKWNDKKYYINLVDIWLESLRKLQEIEEYYNVTFKLENVQGEAATENLYNAIDFIYNGMIMEQNFTISGPKGDMNEVAIITTPELIEEIPEEKADKIQLFNITFIPDRSYLLPGKYNFKHKLRNTIIKLPVCCTCRVVE